MPLLGVRRAKSLFFSTLIHLITVCFFYSPIPQAWRAAKGTQRLHFAEVLPPCYAFALITLPPESNILTSTLYWGCPCLKTFGLVCFLNGKRDFLPHPWPGLLATDGIEPRHASQGELLSSTKSPSRVPLGYSGLHRRVFSLPTLAYGTVFSFNYPGRLSMKSGWATKNMSRRDSMLWRLDIAFPRLKLKEGFQRRRRG